MNPADDSEDLSRDDFTSAGRTDRARGDSSVTGGSRAKGQRLGPYVVVRELGRGGQGVVYLAEDTRLRREVALKALSGLGTDPERVLQRFWREAEVASKLDHPGICGVIDTGVDDGIPYIAMRYVRGESLARRIARARDAADDDATDLAGGASLLFDFDASEVGDLETEVAGPGSATGTTGRGAGESGAGKQDLDAILVLVEEAARALHAAHERGVIHRDVKPANIMIDPENRPVILDFGLARDDSDEAAPTITQTGDIFGTPAYMSPEQLTGQRVRLDGRTDVYSLGATLFECLALQRPFEAPTREALFQAVLTKDVPDIRKICRWVPPDLKVVIETALEKDRDRRYASAKAFADDLAAVRENRPISARPIGRIGRALRFARRRPVTAGLILTLAIGLPLVAALAGYIYAHRDDIEAQARQERAARAESHLADGYYAIFHRSPEDALAEFDAAAELVPGLPEAAGGRALVHLSQNRPESALQALDAADPKERGLRRVRADVYRRLNRDAEASAIDLELGPRGQDAFEWFAIGQQHMARGHEEGTDDSAHATAFEAAAEAFERGIALSERPRLSFHVSYAHAIGHVPGHESDLPLLDAMVRRWPENAWVWYWSGRAEEDIDEALRQLDHAASLDPRIPAEAQKIVSLWTAGREEEAFSRAEEFEKTHPMHSQVGIVIAEAMVRRGEPEKAVAYCEEFLRRDPAHDRIHLTLSLALSVLGRHEEAIAAVRTGVARRPRDARAVRALGEILRKAGRLDEAIAAQQRVLERRPDDMVARSSLALSLMSSNRSREAVTILEKLGEDDPADAQNFSNLASARAMTGDHEGSIAAARHAVELAPDEAEHRVNLALALMRATRYEEARRAADEAIALAPELPQAIAVLGSLAQIEGRTDEGIELLRRANELHPTGQTLANLGTALAASGKIEEGMAYLERAIAMGETRALHPYALQLIGAGRFDEAEEAYRGLLDFDPDHAEAHCNLGNLLWRRGDLESAVTHLRQGHTLGSKLPNWPYNTARSLVSLLGQSGADIMDRDLPRAIALWREALTILPDDPTPHILLATALVADSTPEDMRDPVESLFHAQRANALTQRRHGHFLKALVDSLEKNGFDESALRCAEEALEKMGGRDVGPVSYESVVKQRDALKARVEAARER
ncbi:MAG: tetratricopeptide repeat protein [Planctomycetota bacterium]